MRRLPRSATSRIGFAASRVSSQMPCGLFRFSIGASTRSTGWWTRRRTAERVQQLRVLVVVMNEVRAVAVRDPEVAVRRNRDVRRPVIESRFTRAFLVRRRLLRVSSGPDFLALQRALRDDAVFLVAEVKVLITPFLLKVHAVRAAPEHGAERPDEPALVVEHDDGVAALARRVHGVVDVDQPVRILDNRMRVAVL